MACLTEYTSDNSNCPGENGPDYDFGASPMLITLDDGRELVVGGQKSGGVMAIDPDTGETALAAPRWAAVACRAAFTSAWRLKASASYVPINDMAYAGDVVRYAGARPEARAVRAGCGQW